MKFLYFANNNSNIKDVLFYYTIALSSLVLFLSGFFPFQKSPSTKPILLPSFLNDIPFNITYLYKQEIDKLVFIVIDALRLDFIQEDNVPFISSVYRDKGCLLTVNVESPTVTLPRIKALTTGNVPQFIDIILNLASTEILTDSLLHKARKIDGKKIVFYGDNTWLTLYPDMFTRSEGVSSFYVNDFTEVDDNVTRNLLEELHNVEDWDIMILHYLGLDHIGHVYGPYSQFIKPKLKEMDDIVKVIYETLNVNEKTLIAITGDHGMKDSGGHGGSTFGETHVPFISIGVPCKSTTEVAQIDIPATLASLFGLPHPDGSVGCVISDMLIDFSYERLLYILRYNSLFLKSKLNECGGLFEEASKLHYDFLKTNNESDAIRAKKLYESCSKEIRNNLVHKSVQQDFYSLIIGSEIFMIAFFGIIYNLILCTKINNYCIKIVVITIIVFEITFPKFALLRIVFTIINGLLIMYFAIKILKVLKLPPGCDINSYVIAAISIHCLSLLSSSFIEEEHQVWYFYISTLMMVNIYSTIKKGALKWLLSLLAFRILRMINQTGDKWTHLPDLSQWLLLEENNIFLQILYCFSLVLIVLSALLLGLPRKTITLIIITLSLIYALSKSTVIVKIIWFLILFNFCIAFLQNSQYVEHLIIAWLLFCTLLMRPYNTILLPACIFLSHLIYKEIQDVRILTVIHIWLGQTLFFCQGHSNSLASVDVASGYVGIQEYIPFVVILQVLCHTYTFPVLANMLMLKYYSLYADTIWTVNILCRLIVLIVTGIIILIQQHHVFIWTVFAPKLLIESCHTVVLFVQIVVYYCIKYLYNVIYCNKI